MAGFFNNLRATNNLPKWGTVEDGQEQQEYFDEEAGYVAELKKEYDQERKETAPMREAIKELSGGKVIVKDNVHNPETLKNIMASVLRMNQFNDGALFPGYTEVSDPGYSYWRRWDDNNLGEFISGEYGRAIAPHISVGTKNHPYEIYLRDTNYPEWNLGIATDDSSSGWWPKTGDEEDYPVPTHELAHSAQRDAAKKVKNPGLTMDYAERIRRQKFMSTHEPMQKLFDIAANRLGFNSLQEAAENVSGYAATDPKKEESGKRKAPKDWSPGVRLPEVFAEAYTDVLYNKNNANPYSKELINLYTEYVNDYEEAFGKRDNKNIDSFKMALGILPPLRDEENFIKKLRTLKILPEE